MYSCIQFCSCSLPVMFLINLMFEQLFVSYDIIDLMNEITVELALCVASDIVKIEVGTQLFVLLQKVFREDVIIFIPTGRSKVIRY